MNKLFYMDFLGNKVKINNLLKKEEVLSEIRANSAEELSMPKVTDLYYDLFFPKAPNNRPYIFSSIVLSADGKMAFTDNAAGPLVAKNNYLDPDGALADFWVLNVLRAYADGIIIGANTLKNEENITSHVYDKELVEQRKTYLKKDKHPYSIIVSFDATDIPLNHMIFNVEESEEYKVIIATSPKGKKYIEANSPLKHTYIGPFNSMDEVDASSFDNLDKDYDIVPVIVTGENNNPDSNVLLYVLRKLGLEKLCIESPTYNWHLMKSGNLDEFFINYSMTYVGGGITPGYSMPFGYINHPHADLLSVGMHKSNFIFTRQKLHYDVTSSVDLSIYKY
jgi:riboflavin biosynthesis pyrimidine reductase